MKINTCAVFVYSDIKPHCLLETSGINLCNLFWRWWYDRTKPTHTPRCSSFVLNRGLTQFYWLKMITHPDFLINKNNQTWIIWCTCLILCWTSVWFSRFKTLCCLILNETSLYSAIKPGCSLYSYLDFGFSQCHSRTPMTMMYAMYIYIYCICENMRA